MARPKKAKRESSFVTLRTKEVAKGRKSYYLDIYRDGKRSYEFLKLYTVPETSRAAKIQNENTEFMEEDEIPDFIIRRHNEFVANQRREAHRSRREEDSRERKDYKKEYSSHSDRPRKDDEQKFSGPKRPFDKGRGGGFKKNFGSHSKGGFQRRGKED